MKKTKPKSSKAVKGAAKASPKKAKKELESGIAEKFLDVVTSLGHDAERIAKDIKKMSKEIAKKLSDKIKQNKEVGKKATRAQKESAKREVRASKKEAAKPTRAEKVVAKVAAKPTVQPLAKRTPRITSAEAPRPRTRRTTSTTAEKQAEPVAKAPVQRTRRIAAPKPVASSDDAPVKEPETNNPVNQPGQETQETKPE